MPDPTPKLTAEGARELISKSLDDLEALNCRVLRDLVKQATRKAFEEAAEEAWKTMIEMRVKQPARTAVTRAIRALAQEPDAG